MIHEDKQPMHIISDFESISRIVTDLRNRGYQLKFRRETDCLNCIELNYLVAPNDFTVDEYYYFEDASNADKARTLYAVSSIQGFKGFLVDACFVYEDNISHEMAQKLRWEYEIPA